MEPQAAWYNEPSALLTELKKGIGVRGRPPQVSNYDDIVELRRGGQGTVYSAIQRSTRRRVAIKVLYEECVPSGIRRRRFEREIELIAAIEHPHIVRIYDSGVSPDDRLYLVMEFVQGLDLDEWAGMRPPRDGAPVPVPTLDERLRLFAKICGAVAHAHRHGVIHRDLKPSNIRVDADGQPHVLDFGVARAVEPDGSEASRRTTLTGHFLGTLAYASPEQVSGHPSQVDVCSDVYSLGVMLYELLTGQLPYPCVGSIAQIVDVISHQEVVAPSRLRGCDIKTSFLRRATRWRSRHTELDTIVLKSLAKDPAERYSSAHAFTRDIERLLRGEPIEAKRDNAWYLVTKTLRRYRWQSAVAAAFLLAVFFFGIAMSVLYRSRDLEARKAQQIRVFLEDTLGSVEPSGSLHDVTLREVLNQAIHFVDTTLSGQPEIEASLRTTIGNSFRVLGLYSAAEEQISRALEIRRSRFGTDHLETAQSLTAWGQLHAARGEWTVADHAFREALGVRIRRLGPDHVEVAYLLQDLAAAAEALGNPEVAEKLYWNSLDTISKSRGVANPDAAMVQFKLAEFLIRSSRPGEGAALHRAALDTRLSAHDLRHPDVMRSLAAIGRITVELLPTGPPEPLLHDCLELGHSDSVLEERLRDLQRQGMAAGCLAALGRIEAAEVVAARVHGELTRLYGPDHAVSKRASARTEAIQRQKLRH